MSQHQDNPDKNDLHKRMDEIGKRITAEGPEKMFDTSRPTQLSVGIIAKLAESSIFVLKTQARAEFEASAGIAAAAFKPDKFWIVKLEEAQTLMNISVDRILDAFLTENLKILPHAPANVFIEKPEDGDMATEKLFSIAKNTTTNMWFRYGKTRFSNPTRSEWSNYFGSEKDNMLSEIQSDLIVAKAEEMNPGITVSEIGRDCIKMTYMCYQHNMVKNAPRNQ